MDFTLTIPLEGIYQNKDKGESSNFVYYDSFIARAVEIWESEFSVRILRFDFNTGLASARLIGPDDNGLELTDPNYITVTPEIITRLKALGKQKRETLEAYRTRIGCSSYINQSP